MNMQKIIMVASFIASAPLVTSCGGSGGGDSNEPLSAPFTPSVVVSGLDVAENVTFQINGETIIATVDGNYSASAVVAGDYTAQVTVNPAGKACVFPSGSAYSGSATSLSLSCAASTGVNSTVLDIGSGPHQSYGWLVYLEGGTSPIVLQLTSLLDFQNRGLTNATANNFVFFDESLEVQNSAEFKFHVQPIQVGNVITNAAIAVDISTSLTQAQVDTMKAQLDSFFASSAGGNQQYRLSQFDNDVTALAGYTSDAATLQAAAATIPSTVGARAATTNLYDAAADAALSALRSEAELDYLVIVTDGEHTIDGRTESDISTELEFQLVFAVAVGPDANLDALEALVSLPAQGPQPNRVLQIADMGQLDSALQQISGYVANMVGGLHKIYYLTPRRSATGTSYVYQSKPLSDCAAGATILTCEWFSEYDSSAMLSEPTRIYAFPNAIDPNTGDTVRITIPDWQPCSPTPAYQWAPTNGTGAVVAGTNDTVYDLTLTADSASVSITDTNDVTCLGVVALP